MKGRMVRAVVVMALAGWRLANPPVVHAAAAGPCQVLYCDGTCQSANECADGCNPICVFSGMCGHPSSGGYGINCGYIE